MRTIDPGIRKLYKDSEEARKYIRTDAQIGVFGCGWNHIYLSIDESPKAKDGSYTFKLVFDHENPKDVAAAKKLKGLYDNLENWRDKAEQFRIDMKQALETLGTEKRIVAEFPELEPYFAKEERLEIVPSFSELHDQLKGIAATLKCV